MASGLCAAFAEVLPSLGARYCLPAGDQSDARPTGQQPRPCRRIQRVLRLLPSRGGYSGVAVYCSDRLRATARRRLPAGCRRTPNDSVGSWPDGPGLSAAVGCDDDPAARVALDSEGRCLLIEFPTRATARPGAHYRLLANADPSNEARMQFKMRYPRLAAAEGDCLIRSGQARDHRRRPERVAPPHRSLRDEAEALPISGGDGEPAGRGSYSDALHQSFLAKPVRHWLDRL
uniref:SHSP domain-containing protein n=1 Tax=Macrostomum lignano TaxID=282301 RepID=A0A1I8F202_9PLAT